MLLRHRTVKQTATSNIKYEIPVCNSETGLSNIYQDLPCCEHSHKLDDQETRELELSKQSDVLSDEVLVCPSGVHVTRPECPC